MLKRADPRNYIPTSSSNPTINVKTQSSKKEYNFWIWQIIRFVKPYYKRLKSNSLIGIIVLLLIISIFTNKENKTQDKKLNEVYYNSQESKKDWPISSQTNTTKHTSYNATFNATSISSTLKTTAQLDSERYDTLVYVNNNPTMFLVESLEDNQADLVEGLDFVKWSYCKNWSYIAQFLWNGMEVTRKAFDNMANAGYSPWRSWRKFYIYVDKWEFRRGNRGNLSIQEIRNQPWIITATRYLNLTNSQKNEFIKVVTMANKLYTNMRNVDCELYVIQ